MPTVCWTKNVKHNALHEIHRFNVRSALGRQAVESFQDGFADVRFDFVRSAPDVATWMHALRTELSMKAVMPAVLPQAKHAPYLSMARFETGSSGNHTFMAFVLQQGVRV